MFVLLIKSAAKATAKWQQQVKSNEYQATRTQTPDKKRNKVHSISTINEIHSIPDPNPIYPICAPNWIDSRCFPHRISHGEFSTRLRYRIRIVDQRPIKRSFVCPLVAVSCDNIYYQLLRILPSISNAACRANATKLDQLRGTIMLIRPGAPLKYISNAFGH